MSPSSRPSEAETNKRILGRGSGERVGGMLGAVSAGWGDRAAT